MKNKELIKQLNIELNALPIPNVIEKVRQNSSIVPLKEKMVTTQTKKHSLLFRFVPAVMAVVLLAVVIFNSLAGVTFETLTTITVDINPSIELTLNEEEEVVEITPVNTDATTLLQDLNLLGDKLEAALEKLLDKAKEHGYIQNNIANAILLSVKNKNQEKKDSYKTKLQNKLNDYLEENDLDCNVIFEEYEDELLEEYEELKETFEEDTNMTPAKYQYIKRIIERFSNLVGYDLSGYEEYLAGMNVEELYELLNEETSGTNVAEIIARIITNGHKNNGNGNGSH